MSTLDEIYQLRENGEEAIRSSFAAMDFAAITRQNAPEKFQQIRPRVEIKLRIGAATGHKFICPDTVARYDCFFCNVAVQCVTAPVGDSQQNVLHGVYVARVRSHMATIGQVSFTDEVNFPLVHFAEPLRDAGTDSVLDVEKGVEFSTLGFTGILCIRKTAWPNN